MKVFCQSAPLEPGDLLIRMHNLVGAAVDISGPSPDSGARWTCHGCGESSREAVTFWYTRGEASAHAAQCRAVYHRLH
ncbi:hypothetical protein ABZ543_07185 [Streptomyces roseifaciens]